MRGSARALVLGVLGVALAAPAASASTLTVDDNRRECKRAEFMSIEAAVQAAAPGDTVRVCPGTYPELVTVDKPLEVRGPDRGSARAPGQQEPDARRDAIVVNGGQGAFDIEASGVVVAGFTIQGNQAAASYPNAGITVRSGADRVIDGNVLRANGIGVYVEGAQSELEVRQNAFINNARTPAIGLPSGGLFAAGGESAGGLRDTEIEQNFFTGNGQFSINVGSGSAGGLRIEHNEAVADATFVVIGRTTDARVEHNRVEEARASGVSAFGDNVRLRIAYNDLDGSATSSFGVALRAGRFGTTGGNPGVLVEHNRIEEWFDGINVDMGVSDGGTIAHNHTRDNDRHGIRLFNGDGFLVERNDSRDNTGDGIRMDPQSAGNTVTNNQILGNGEHDCHDDTTGPNNPPALVANVWADNHARTENRPGLCVEQTP